MPHLGVPELLIILVIVILVFGAGKLPQIGGAIGKSIQEFRQATKKGEDDEEPVARRKESSASSEPAAEDKQA